MHIHLSLKDCVNLKAFCVEKDTFRKIKSRSQSDTLLSPSQSSKIGKVSQNKRLSDTKDKDKDKDKTCIDNIRLLISL